MTFRNAVIALSCSCLLGVGFVSPARAVLIRSDQIVSPRSALQQRVDGWLARQQVRDELAARGVDPAQVRARVAALTDDEARDLAQRIDSMPAGGDAGTSVIGVLFAVFVILLITDILGLTHVFPFTRPIHR
jgi:hypothetical protein